ncbi:MAG: phosphopentomutase [Armatimonadota bacterium]|nr:phosphopentomutase [Armatimonadota bacterium]MDR5697932.1 phosphopentomutase [Armatimonadota bacterium]
MYARSVVLVLDGLGIGELPDADRYGDTGSATLQNTARAVGGLHLPLLGSLGLGNIVPVEGVPPARAPRASFGRMAQVSAGKDSTTGHWELMGVRLERPFPTYPNGFPAEVIEAFEAAIGMRTLGNVAASGTEIIHRLGPEHMRTGCPIVYTSADSVFQIAAHEDVIPPERLYEMCRVARALLVGEHAVSRVIARPFVGAAGSFQRTDRRKDFSLEPVAPTVLDAIRQAGLNVCAVGKVEDLFAGRGITEAVHTRDDLDGVAQTIAAMGRMGRGLVFGNLVDLDTRYGHRNDPKGYAENLERIDAALVGVVDALSADDILVLTADHGNDPTTPSTDHSREYVPVLVCGPAVRAGVDLGTRETFSDVGATVAQALGVPWSGPGKSFFSEVSVLGAGGRG